MAVREATKDNFRELIQKDVAKVLEDVSLDMPFISILKVNSSKYAALGRSFQVAAFPTILFFRDGTEVHRHIGFMSASDIEAAIGEYLYS